MYTFLFALSLTYLCYNFYHVIKGTVPAWLGKKLRAVEQSPPLEGLDNKRWDTPIGALSKAFACSVLFTSFIVLTYLLGYETLVQNSVLYFVVLFASGGACLTHWNLRRWLRGIHVVIKK
ncbi:hypothetical protein L0657_00390 [Dyadobacter sp. CY345]|uniref:hypothetical protein n=1 Tax=Dyadobacter sp. CY345 TaxID=2909335 RepID=UPI001F40B86C|nr:hypothetical protein [Dyadobacter sp. CY345]MCF2442392.1 hypothetical protein [Dyadobacter sp. CY345]